MTCSTILPAGSSRLAASNLATRGLLVLTNRHTVRNWLTAPESGSIGFTCSPSRTCDCEAAEGWWTVCPLMAKHWRPGRRVRKASNRDSHLTVTLREGKNREVRRLLAAIGHPVTLLRRVQFGGLELARCRQERGGGRIRRGAARSVSGLSLDSLPKARARSLSANEEARADSRNKATALRRLRPAAPPDRPRFPDPPSSRAPRRVAHRAGTQRPSTA